MSKLVDGLIPAHTFCPFLQQCGIVAAGGCHHKGKSHKVAFSCASARAHDILGRSEVSDEQHQRGSTAKKNT